MTRIELLSGHVHVWYARLPAEDWPPSSHPGWELLTEDEHARAGRFLVERARTEFVATRLLLRTLLSEYEPGVAPATWRFAVGQRGRPEIDRPTPSRALRFNVSHTYGGCALAFGIGCAVGVDIEWLGRGRSPLDHVEAFLSPDEAEALAGLTGEAHWERFLEYWTLKESYIKARGEGLALPLDAFTMVFEGGTLSGIAFADAIDDRPERWSFELVRLDDHQLATASERLGDDPVLTVHRIESLDAWLMQRL